MKQILLIDDHSILRLGVRTLLETRKNWKVCAEAGSREEALSLLKKGCPDLAIVDLVLGMDDGLDFIKELKIQCPDLKLLVMTMQDESVYAERVIRAGADGFIEKKDATAGLLGAVETVLSGEVYLSRASSARLLGRLFREKDGRDSDNGIATLSDRELHVFQMLGGGKGPSEISKILNLSPKTIETYKENLKRKLGLKDAHQLRRAAEKWVTTGKE